MTGGRAGGRAASHDECTQYVEEGVAYRSHSTPAALAGCVCVSGGGEGRQGGGGLKGPPLPYYTHVLPSPSLRLRVLPFMILHACASM